MKTFKEFLLIEELGFNLEVLNLSDIIYDTIKENPSIKKIELPENKLKIKNIFLTYNKKISSHLNINKSNINNIHLNINNLNKADIQHELNHTLQFLQLGKKSTLDKHIKYKAFTLSKGILSYEKEFDNLIAFKYLSQTLEIDSFIYNIRSEVIDTFNILLKDIKKEYYYKQVIEKKFNLIFLAVLDNSKVYKMYKDFMMDFNPLILKKISNETLILMLNIIEDNYKFLLKKNYLLPRIFRAIRQILFTKSYISNLDIKITNIDEYLNKLQKDKDNAVDYLTKKIDKLYASVYQELIS